MERGGGNPWIPLELTEIEDDATPLARFANRFQPRGISYGGRAWALVNLLALFCTAYLFLPLLHLRAKYCRRSTAVRSSRARLHGRHARHIAA
ncbi:MAG: hypothetical protein IJR54_03100 [Oscillibacter sp.]|nr:hypothetical protein [Oscillibacter sp.]